MARRRHQQRQLDLDLPTHGGARRGVGRRPRGDRAGVSHSTRPIVTAHRPVHITFRARDHVWNLRSHRCFRVVAHALATARDSSPLRVVHFSVQGNHLHLVCEAPSADALAAGLKGLSVRIARGLNRLMGRRGAVFADRYHAHVLKTPEEVQRALTYVLGNFASHARRRGERMPAGWVDPYSSAGLPDARQDGTAWLWRHAAPDVTARPRSWLLRTAAGRETRGTSTWGAATGAAQ
jgi:REP element-mobilizing transposase RayT